MNCPKCGAQIEENQKFCGNCGAKLNDIENSQNNIETVENNNTESDTKEIISNDNANKIIIVSIILLIILAIFGVIQYKQYQKDIEPLELLSNIDGIGNIVTNIKYNAKNKKVEISIICREDIAENWMKDYLNYFVQKFSERKPAQFFAKDENNNIKIEAIYQNIDIIDGKPLIYNFNIDTKNHKDFYEIKNFLNIANNKKPSLIYLYTPKALSNDKKMRLEYKNKWLKEIKEQQAKEEAERKQREWQENILSNCVYKTSDGACFTTQVHNTEPIIIESTGEKNYWLGAKDFCESKGYKLPTDDDLRSLFQDILGVKVKSGINIKTTKFVNTTEIPINYTPLKKIISKEHWDTFYLWEDSEFDEETAHFRGKKYNSFIGTDETYQGMIKKISYEWEGHPDTICVYNPNGKPQKSLLQQQKDKKAQAERKAQAKKEKELQEKLNEVKRREKLVQETINSLPQNIRTVHRWEKEVNDVCINFLTTENTPKELFNCLIKETQKKETWRDGWEKPVNANVMGILTLYQPEILKLPQVHKITIAEDYRYKIPQMYAQKLKQKPNPDVKFTKEDIIRIWNAKQ